MALDWGHIGGDWAQQAGPAGLRTLGLLVMFLLLRRLSGKLGQDAKFGPITWGLLLTALGSGLDMLANAFAWPVWLEWLGAVFFLLGLILVAQGLFYWAGWVSGLKKHSAERDRLLAETERQSAFLSESHRVAHLGFLLADRALTTIRWHGFGLPALTADPGSINLDVVLNDMVQKADWPQIERARRRVLQDGHHAFDLRLRGRDGSLRWYRIAAKLDERAGLAGAEGEAAKPGIFAVLQDIDAIKRAELARQDALKMAEAASSAKTTFLAAMSHELRTPLNAVLGFSDLLMRPGSPAENDPEKRVEFARDINIAGRHLLAIVDRVLEVVRLDRGRRQLALEQLAPAEEAAEIVAGLRREADEYGVTLDLSVAPGLGEARFDTTILRDILLQLVGNAIKFSREGGRVDIRLEPLGPAPASGLRVSVRDDGIGIAPDQLKRVFELFWQSEDAGAQRQGGTGLGLAIVQRLARLHHGRVWLESALGQGTTAKVDLHPEPPAEEARGAA